MRYLSTTMPATAVLTLLFLAPAIPAGAAVPFPAVRETGVVTSGEKSAARPASGDGLVFTSSSDPRAAHATQEQPAPEAEAGRFGFVLIPLIAAAVVVVGAIFVLSRGRRRRRGD